MTPNFLGIGVPRAGTTWLHRSLVSHSQVYVPSRRKEVSYFNSYYERGIGWYAKFFPKDNVDIQYQAIGEITPNYFFCPACPARIAQIKSIKKLILILRDPVDRLFSCYKHISPNKNYSKFFESFLSDYPEMVKQGFYATHLERYLQHFELKQILVLIYEDMFKNISDTQKKVADFLEINSDGFSKFNGAKIISKSYNPKHRITYAFTARLNRWLRSHDLDYIVNLAIRLQMKKLFGQGNSFTPMTQETKTFLKQTYKSEIEQLELLLHKDLKRWKQQDEDA